jgi:DHA1 family multidrug resistance protein-like MFS transporter
MMVERAMFGGAVVLVAMGFAQNVQQYSSCGRSGIFTGTGRHHALVASSTPRDRAGYARLLQMAVWTGSSVECCWQFVLTWGYRAAFGLRRPVAGRRITVWRFVNEDFTPSRATGRQKRPARHRPVVRDRALVSLFSIRVLRPGRLYYHPILPLFVKPGPRMRIASLTGLISGVNAATSAIGALTLGRASDRLGYRRVLVTCTSLIAVLYVPHFFVTSPWQLLVLQGAMGLVTSGMVASISALMACLAPEGRQGAVYGVDASVVSAANAIGPMLGAGVAATMGLRAPFVLAAGVVAVASGLAWALVQGPTQQTSPAASE